MNVNSVLAIAVHPLSFWNRFPKILAGYFMYSEYQIEILGYEDQNPRKVCEMRVKLILDKDELQELKLGFQDGILGLSSDWEIDANALDDFVIRYTELQQFDIVICIIQRTGNDKIKAIAYKLQNRTKSLITNKQLEDILLDHRFKTIIRKNMNLFRNDKKFRLAWRICMRNLLHRKEFLFHTSVAPVVRHYESTDGSIIEMENKNEENKKFNYIKAHQNSITELGNSLNVSQPNNQTPPSVAARVNNNEEDSRTDSDEDNEPVRVRNIYYNVPINRLELHQPIRRYIPNHVLKFRSNLK
eukprot:NODE_4724_length_1124_cov_40.600400_g4189_i0.p1 GENE.NODE_4724_length_1124_cov_40.600400_g4189_i0~~NODE_4724_length_1124_cov_40.600400_g4189_i0.p1  ORF type:complete len:300 (-),score=6.48 NODE_4724_length_1124_cov_40.600400_g4189_i0:169-1068(-)